MWLEGSRARAQWLWRGGLVAPRHVKSPWTRYQTRVPGIGRRILIHCITREVQKEFLIKKKNKNNKKKLVCGETGTPVENVQLLWNTVPQKVTSSTSTSGYTSKRTEERPEKKSAHPQSQLLKGRNTQDRHQRMK